MKMMYKLWCDLRVTNSMRYVGLRWVETAAPTVLLYRRALLLSGAGIYLRHVRPLAEYPWPLVALSDDRRSQSHKEAILQAFMGKRPCCLRPGLARQLRITASEDGDGASLASPLWRNIFYHMARVLDLSTVGVERRHAWNRRGSHDTTRWATFAAAAVNREAKAASDHSPDDGALAAEPRGQGGEPHGQRGGATARVAGYMKAQSALELFRTDHFATQRALGKARAWSAEQWPGIRAAFDALPEQEQAAYRSQAVLSVSVAKANRADRAAKAQAITCKAPGQLSTRPADSMSANLWFTSPDVPDDGAGEPPNLDAFALPHGKAASPAPLSAEKLHWALQAKGRVSGRVLLDSFMEDMQATDGTAATSPGPKPFPATVDYSLPCGRFCTTTTAKADLCMFRALVAGLRRSGRQLAGTGGPASVCEKDALLEMLLFDTVDPTGEPFRSEFVHVAQAHGRGGETTALILVAMEAVGYRELLLATPGTCLRFSLADWVQQIEAWGHPYEGTCRRGGLVYRTEHEQAEHVMQLGRCLRKAVIRRVTYKRQGLDRVVLCDADDSFQEVVILRGD